MAIIIHPHALERMKERGTNEEEIKHTIEYGEEFTAKNERTGFRMNFPYADNWRGKYYNNKQIEVYAVKEFNNWVVITVISKYF
jgi:hypothetical protein